VVERANVAELILHASARGEMGPPEFMAMFANWLREGR
jgi:hypothetical protein